MGMGSYLLAGALSGIGGGMAQKQKVADEERRDAALSALRRGEIDLQYQKAGENQAAESQRAADRGREERADNHGFQIKLAEADAKSKAAEGAAARQHELQLENLKSANRRAEIITETNAKAQSEAEQIFDVKVDGPTGALFGVRKNGDVVPLNGAIARPNPAASANDTPLLSGQPPKTLSNAQADYVFDPVKGTLVSTKER